MLSNSTTTSETSLSTGKNKKVKVKTIFENHKFVKLKFLENHNRYRIQFWLRMLESHRYSVKDGDKR